MNNQLTGCIPPAPRDVRRNDLAALGLPHCAADLAAREH